MTPATERGSGGSASGSGAGDIDGRYALASCDLVSCDLPTSCDLISCDLSRHLLLQAISLHGVTAEGPRAQREVDERRTEPMSKTSPIGRG